MPTIPVLAMHDLVQVVNEYADVPRAVAGEQDLPYPEVADVVDEPGVLAGQRPRALVSAANEAYRVFAAAPEGRALRSLNTMLRAAAPAPVATEHGTRWSVRDRRQVLPGAAAICLLDWLAAHGQHRIGLCHAERCADAYADASPAGSRRFCSATCLNRHKVAAHRDRLRQRRA